MFFDLSVCVCVCRVPSILMLFGYYFTYTTAIPYTMVFPAHVLCNSIYVYSPTLCVRALECVYVHCTRIFIAGVSRNSPSPPPQSIKENTHWYLPMLCVREHARALSLLFLGKAHTHTQIKKHTSFSTNIYLHFKYRFQLSTRIKSHRVLCLFRVHLITCYTFICAMALRRLYVPIFKICLVGCCCCRCCPWCSSAVLMVAVPFLEAPCETNPDDHYWNGKCFGTWPV